jgi:hypothetical protein
MKIAAESPLSRSPPKPKSEAKPVYARSGVDGRPAKVRPDAAGGFREDGERVTIPASKIDRS